LWVDGLEPDFQILEEFASENDATEAETFWIAAFRSYGATLLNMTDGGEGSTGWIATAETRLKMIESSKTRRPVSEKTRQRMSAAQKGRTFTPEAIEKMRKAHANISPETRAKMSAAQKGKAPSKETCLKISIANTGHTMSPKSRAKLAASKAGRKLTPEHCAAISNGHRLRRLRLSELFA